MPLELGLHGPIEGFIQHIGLGTLPREVGYAFPCRMWSCGSYQTIGFWPSHLRRSRTVKAAATAFVRSAFEVNGITSKNGQSSP